MKPKIIKCQVVGCPLPIDVEGIVCKLIGKYSRVATTIIRHRAGGRPFCVCTKCAAAYPESEGWLQSPLGDSRPAGCW
jgi:hypothetical protein